MNYANRKLWFCGNHRDFAVVMKKKIAIFCYFFVIFIDRSKLIPNVR